MAGLYLYAPTQKIPDLTECGIKMSEWYDREIELMGQTGRKRALRALLNPRDDLVRAKDEHYRCIRIEVDPEQCQVGDAILYQMGCRDEGIMRRYLEALVPLSRYRFGVFRNPECLIFTSLLPDRIEVTGKAQDIPVLFESSEALYLGNAMERIEQEHQDSGNTLLYAYCAYLESKGRLIRQEDAELGITLFVEPATQQYIVTRTP